MQNYMFWSKAKNTRVWIDADVYISKGTQEML